jgi:hypothetical protein
LFGSFFGSNNSLLALAMPTAHTTGKLNKIKGFGESDFLRRKQIGNFWHSRCASGEVFWRDWHNKKAPNHFGLGLGGKNSISRMRDRRSTAHL